VKQGRVIRNGFLLVIKAGEVDGYWNIDPCCELEQINFNEIKIGGKQLNPKT